MCWALALMSLHSIAASTQEDKFSGKYVADLSRKHQAYDRAKEQHAGRQEGGQDTPHTKSTKRRGKRERERNNEPATKGGHADKTYVRVPYVVAGRRPHIMQGLVLIRCPFGTRVGPNVKT